MRIEEQGRYLQMMFEQQKKMKNNMSKPSSSNPDSPSAPLSEYPVAAELDLAETGADAYNANSAPKDCSPKYGSVNLNKKHKVLEDSLCKQGIVTRDETMIKWLDPEAAAVSRDALAKIMYSRLFDWLVDKINNSIVQNPNSKSLIRVLDYKKTLENLVTSIRGIHEHMLN